ncbi:hypothetical protein PR048_004423 [Dryococelus australis]|uniref:Uncharacterized protein n=1 Tax=Dryococelus australis TaxID=614101 RepID=A0ABQ9I5E2_9NEOP|nr:hypothetical protein PR048_004423 [Dryococelus australis]
MLETIPKKSRDSLAFHFKAVAPKCLTKLRELRVSDREKLFISAVGTLLDPRNDTVKTEAEFGKDVDVLNILLSTRSDSPCFVERVFSVAM